MTVIVLSVTETESMLSNRNNAGMTLTAATGLNHEWISVLGSTTCVGNVEEFCSTVQCNNWLV